MGEYEPEIGQILFGQPFKQFAVSELCEAALVMIESEIERVMWNAHQAEYPSPFRNTGSSFECDAFMVEAYRWGDQSDQTFNFKWGDVEISWYKHLGRGMSSNIELTPGIIDRMLTDCLAAVRAMDTP